MEKRLHRDSSLFYSVPRKRNLLCTFFIALCPLLGNGCALHYFDEKTQIQHIWGFGHLKMKQIQSEDGVVAIVTGTESAGVKIDAGTSDYGLTAGWSREQDIAVLGDNTSLRLEWPSKSPFEINLGVTPPLLWNARSAASSNPPVASKVQQKLGKSQWQATQECE